MKSQEDYQGSQHRSRCSFEWKGSGACASSSRRQDSKCRPQWIQSMWTKTQFLCQQSTNFNFHSHGLNGSRVRCWRPLSGPFQRAKNPSSRHDLSGTRFPKWFTLCAWASESRLPSQRPGKPRKRRRALSFTSSGELMTERRRKGASLITFRHPKELCLVTLNHTIRLLSIFLARERWIEIFFSLFWRITCFYDFSWLNGTGSRRHRGRGRFTSSLKNILLSGPFLPILDLLRNAFYVVWTCTWLPGLVKTRYVALIKLEVLQNFIKLFYSSLLLNLKTWFLNCLILKTCSPSPQHKALCTLVTLTWSVPFLQIPLANSLFPVQMIAAYEVRSRFFNIRQ